MTENISSKENESPSPTKIHHATVKACGIAFGMLIIVIFAIATWKSLIIGPLVNALIFVYIITGNPGISILILSIMINGLSLLISAPRFRVEQKMLEIDPSGQELLKKQSQDVSKPSSGCLIGVLTGIWQGLVGVVSVALIWVFWYVFLPESELSANLDSFLWPPLDPLLGSFNTHFMYLDLLDRDLHRVSWSPYPLPGLFVLTSTLLDFGLAYLRDAIKKKHGLALLSKRMRGCILWSGPLLTLIFGLIFPSGVVLYWLVGKPFRLLELWLFPLAVVND